MKLFKIALLTLLFIGCQNNSNTTNLNTNFVHVVYFWLHNPQNIEDRKEFEAKLNAFLETSQYAQTKFVGIPAMTDREVVDNSYTYALIVSFSSKAEEHQYQIEPAHVKFVEEAKHLWSKVVVYDALKN